MTHPHRIEITLTEDDYFALTRFVSFRSKTMQTQIRKFQWASMIVFLISVLLCLLYVTHKNPLSEPSIMMDAVVFALMVFMLWRLPKSTRKSVGKKMEKNIRNIVRELQGDLFGKTETMELREDGVHNQCAVGQSVFPYAAMGEIAEDKNHAYAFVGTDRALILPRDRIPAETLDAFLGELKTRMARAKETKVDISHD